MLLPLFEWMKAQAVYGSSPYIGPVVNLVHLLSMVTLAGSLLIVDLRLMGLGLTGQSVLALARDASPWRKVGLTGILMSGIPQLMERATDQYATSIFWAKMYLLLFSLIWMATARRSAVKADTTDGAWPKVVGLVSIVSILGVAALGRLIMLLPADSFVWLVGA